MQRALALVRVWLLLDFFGDSRRRNQPGSTLTSTIFTQSFIALVVAAVLFDERAHLVSYAAANLSLSTILVGMGLLADPQRTERRLADRMLIATAPLGRATLPMARAMHGAFHITLVTTGMAIPPAILSYWVAGHDLTVVPMYVALASLLSGTLAGGLGLFVRLMVRVQGPARAALIAGTLKAVLLGGGFLGFALCLPHMQGTADDLPLGRAGAMVWPPYWAARWLAAPGADIGFLIALLATGVALFAASAVLGERERPSTGQRTARRSVLAAIEKRLARGGPLLGETVFVGKMLYRSPGFRARVLPLFGVPMAMVLLAFSEQGSDERRILLGMTLQFPAIYLPFLIVFLPFAEHTGSAWMFESSPRHSLALAREASTIALSVRILLPVQFAALVLLLAFGFDPALAVGLPVFSWSLGVLVAALSTQRLECVPFTQQEGEGGGPEFGGILTLAIALALAGCAFAAFAQGVSGPIVAALAAGLAWRRLGRARESVHE